MRATVLVALFSWLAACGARDQAPKESAQAAGEPAKNAPALDACSLLTGEEIEAAVGWRPAKAEPSTYGATATCNFYGPQGFTQTVSLVVAPGMPQVSSSTDMAAWRTEQTKGYADVKFIIEPVEGLGVPAIRNEIEGTGMATIEAAAKGMLLDVTSGTLEASKALVAKALPRLP